MQDLIQKTCDFLSTFKEISNSIIDTPKGAKDAIKKLTRVTSDLEHATWKAKTSLIDTSTLVAYSYFVAQIIHFIDRPTKDDFKNSDILAPNNYSLVAEKLESPILGVIDNLKGFKIFNYKQLFLNQSSWSEDRLIRCSNEWINRVYCDGTSYFNIVLSYFSLFWNFLMLLERCEPGGFIDGLKPKIGNLVQASLLIKGQSRLYSSDHYHSRSLSSKSRIKDRKCFEESLDFPIFSEYEYASNDPVESILSVSINDTKICPKFFDTTDEKLD